jgi:hypothetical protein
MLPEIGLSKAKPEILGTRIFRVRVWVARFRPKFDIKLEISVTCTDLKHDQQPNKQVLKSMQDCKSTKIRLREVRNKSKGIEQ